MIAKYGAIEYASRRLPRSTEHSGPSGVTNNKDIESGSHFTAGASDFQDTVNVMGPPLQASPHSSDFNKTCLRTSVDICGAMGGELENDGFIDS